jgi:hypothetical protein
MSTMPCSLRYSALSGATGGVPATKAAGADDGLVAEASSDAGSLAVTNKNAVGPGAAAGGAVVTRVPGDPGSEAGGERVPPNDPTLRDVA